MKSRDYFDAFCRVLEGALEPGPGDPLRSKDREIFLRAKEVLRICYDGNTDRKLCDALQRRACEIMLDVGDPGEWDGALAVYGAAWRLSNVLPDADAAAPSPDGSGQSQMQDLLYRVQDLEHQIDLINSELDIQPAMPGEDNSRIAALLTRLDELCRTLVLVKDIAGGGVTVPALFGAGATGVRLIDRISDAIVAVLHGARDIALEPLARDLLREAATGAGDLVRWIAGSVDGNPDLSDCAKNFVERIEPYLDAEPVGDAHRIFRDIAEPWCPEMVEIPPGAFLMGSNDPAYQDEIPQRPVEIGHRFAVARNPVTFDEYDAFCQAARRDKPADNGWGRDRRPVINVSWEDAKSYVEWLSGKTGQRYRLLTEAEWEYVCRAGSTTRYSFGDDDKYLNEHGWYVGNLNGQTAPVGKRLANDFGLFDMHGNVWEWVEDVWHHNYQGTPPGNGSAWLDGGNQRERVMRGGSWVSGSRGLRSAVRVEGATDYRHNNVGFRVARTL